MPSTVKLRNRVNLLLQDDAGELSPVEVDNTIAEAVYEFSVDRPRKLSATVNGVAGDIPITSATNASVYYSMLAWDSPQSFFRRIEYPIQTTGDVVYIPGRDFFLHPEGDDVPTAIRFIKREPPTGTNNVRLYYKDLHLYLYPPEDLRVETAGTAGTATYSYRVTARDASGGETMACDAYTIPNGNATLDGTNYNTITWEAVYGATDYRIYRVTGGASTGLLTAVTAPTVTYNDQGAAATTDVPIADTTVTTVETRPMEAVAHLATAKCLEAIATKKAGNFDADINGDSTNFGAQMERYATRAEVHRSYYNLRMKPKPEDLQAAHVTKTLEPPPSDGGSYIFDDYNYREPVR